MFKKFFFAIICVIFLAVSTCYAAPNNLVNLGTGNPTASKLALSSFWVGSAALLGLGAWELNKGHKSERGGAPTPPPPSPAPTITNVNPPSGPVSGGTSVTITGTNFVNGATVTFGGIAATGVTLISSTQIDCITPAHAEGQVGVTVTNPDGKSGTKCNAYTYEMWRIYLSTYTNELYRVNEDDTSTDEWTQIGKRPLEVDYLYSFVLSPDGKKIFMITDGSSGYQMYSVASDAESLKDWDKVGNRPSVVTGISSFALSPDGKKIFIRTPSGSQMYSVLADALPSKDWDQVGKRPSVVTGIDFFALSPDGKKIFMQTYGASYQMYSVASDAESSKDWDQVGNRPPEVTSIISFVLSPDGNKIFMKTYGSSIGYQMYSVLAGASSSEPWDKVGDRPSEVTYFYSPTLSPDGNKIFMRTDGSSGYQMYSVLAGASSLEPWDKVGDRPSEVDNLSTFALSPDGNKIFMRTYGSSIGYQMYSVLAEASSLEPWDKVGNIPTGPGAYDIDYYFSLSSDGKTIVISGTQYSTSPFTSQMYKIAADASPSDLWDQVGKRPSTVNLVYDFNLFPKGNKGNQINRYLKHLAASIFGKNNLILQNRDKFKGLIKNKNF